ncbi:MAG: TIGR00725 family protein [Candidatus Hodarchaeales archaeon]
MKPNNKTLNIQIGIIGDSRIRSKKQYEISYQIGAEIARRNIILLCGGRGGVMEAACKGAFDNDGITVGILPLDIKDPEINPYLTIRIPTMLSWTRNTIIPLASDAIIACGGSSGTLSEISFTWLYNKPLICIEGVGGLSQEMINMKKQDSQVFIPNCIPASDGADAVVKALNLIKQDFHGLKKDENTLAPRDD